MRLSKSAPSSATRKTPAPAPRKSAAKTGRGKVPKSAAKGPLKGADTYHHGDLRAALLRAAGALLAERGVEGFTLRECARRAGVSHGAPAHHFGDAAGMLTAYAAQGYGRMTALMHAYQEQAAKDGSSLLKAAGLAYIDFAVANRAQFQLMFRSDRLNGEDEDFKAAAQGAYAMLSGAMHAAASGAAADPLIGDRMLLAWSAVHGFATLVLEGQLAHHYAGQSSRDFARAAGERLVALLGPVLGDHTGDRTGDGKGGVPGAST